MSDRTTIMLLFSLAVAQAACIGMLLGSRRPGLLLRAQEGTAAVAEKPAGPEPAPVATAGPGDAVLAPAELAKKNDALATELAEVKKELDVRRSEISFSYGSVRESGRFVGMTFRKMFETAAAREATEAQARMADNQINVLSLGPFIQDAEVMESDPIAFAQFQAPLISEVLGLPVERGAEIESVLGDLKAQSLKFEAGTPEWAELNDAALKKITGMLSAGQQQAMKRQLDFFQQYGVLVIPAYALLRAPTPTVVSPVK